MLQQQRHKLELKRIEQTIEPLYISFIKNWVAIQAGFEPAFSAPITIKWVETILDYWTLILAPNSGFEPDTS